MDQRLVFYVDDNPKAQGILTFALEWAEYKVVTDCTGEALERMKQTPSDLVLLAYRVSRGSKLSRKTKQLNPDVPIVLVSGHTVLASGQSAYVNAYVGKGTHSTF